MTPNSKGLKSGRLDNRLGSEGDEGTVEGLKAGEEEGHGADYSEGIQTN